MKRTDYEQLMDLVDFLLNHMANMKAQAKASKPMARRLILQAEKIEGWAVLVQVLAMQLGKEGVKGAGTPNTPSKANKGSKPNTTDK